MKVTYQFDLSKDDIEDLKIFQQSRHMYFVLWDFAHNVKHRSALLAGDQLEGYDLAMEHFFNLMKEYEVNL